MTSSSNNTKEVFLKLLSDVRQSTERAMGMFQEMSQVAQDPDVKEALQARVFVAQKNIDELDECFKIIGVKPVPISGRMYEMFMEDFTNELDQIQSPEARRLFILAKAIHLVHMRIGEYVVLIAAADNTGHYGVGVLLESCLADKLAFIERARRLILAREREMAMA